MSEGGRGGGGRGSEEELTNRCTVTVVRGMETERGGGGEVALRVELDFGLGEVLPLPLL